MAASPAAVSSAPAPKALTDFLFETIVCDVHSCAIEVGALTMALAAGGGPDAASRLHAFRHLLHDDSKIMALALRYGDEAGLGREAVAKLMSLYAGVAEGKQRLHPLTDPATLSGAQREQAAKFAESWRKLAGLATQALAVIDAPTRQRLSAVYLEDAAALKAFLDEATRGGKGRVDEWGVLRPPQLRQRRVNPRLNVRRTCGLTLPNGASYRATVEDVSREGLGLISDAPLLDQQAVIIALDDGRRLEATVARRQGSRIGLALTTRLAANDPLFSA